MPSRKRKHTEISPESEDVKLLQEANFYDPEKEQSVWDSFKDEYFEGVQPAKITSIEQLPLTLHRQYALVKELDQQANVHAADLLALILRYINERKGLNHCQQNTNSAKGVLASNRESAEPYSALDTVAFILPASPEQANTKTLRVVRSKSPSSRPVAVVSARQLLTRIASLAQELLRTSEEKVNVAQAACDSVGRHVRMLQQAIKEQEDSINLGARPGHLELSNLSDLYVGRWVKPTRSVLSPINSDDVEDDHRGNDPDTSFLSQHLGKNARSKQKLPPSGDAPKIVQLKITLPAQAPLLSASGTSEEVYCYCQRGSFGEMIACDNKKCPREWYHVGCVGMKTSPEGLKTWYCPDCQPMRRGVHKRK